MDMMDFFKTFPIQTVYVVVAIAGGIARYLNSFANGNSPFKLSVFFASAFMAGFSGLMFALVGDSLNMPFPISHIMAGVGGFFGEQTMKLVLEFVSKKSNT
jgi:hypothetical protein